MPESQAHPRVPCRFLDQYPVQVGPADGVDDLMLALAVGLQLCLARYRMNHPSAHGDQERTDALHHVSSLECRDAASRESEVDGAPALALCEPRVGPAIVDIDRESTACEEHGEQRAR